MDKRQAADDPYEMRDPRDTGDTPAPWRAGLRSWSAPTPAETTGLIVLVVGVVAVAGLLVWDAGRRPAEPAAALGVALADFDHEQGLVTPGASDPLSVHVAGAVRAPGVRRLLPGARVADAIEASGGPTADAVLDRINLARPLVDGEQVLVPRASDVADPGADVARTPDGRIDVNRADAVMLEQLPGIGPARAAAIIEHRERHGPFRVPGDLREVTGIGETTFQRLAELVAVG
jgi:competence protein ComEA